MSGIRSWQDTITDISIDFDPHTRRTNNQAHALGRRPDIAFRGQGEDITKNRLARVWARPVYTAHTLAIFPTRIEVDEMGRVVVTSKNMARRKRSVLLTSREILR
jgi:hypothetical protein